MTKISAFIIAKNEEARIETALKSLVSFCDEIIVVDTGSTDKTKEVASNYTEKIYDFEWMNDFSAARNFALSKCTGDWVIFLDADDEIDLLSQNKIKETIKNAEENTAGYFLNYQYGKSKNLLTPRLFRRSAGLQFQMPIHEYLNIPPKFKNRFQPLPDAIIIHNKKEENNAETLRRNINILEEAIKKDPQNNHFQFFLGREYFNTGKFHEAIKILEKLVQSKNDTTFLYNVYLHLGLCFDKLKDYEQAIGYFQKANSTDGRFAEPLIYEANILLYHLKQVAEAKKLYERTLKISRPQTTFPVNENFYHEYPIDQLTKIERLNKPIALVCGYYGKLNIGDELMLASIIENLPQYRIIVASYDPALTREIHKIESVPHKHQLFDQALRQAKTVIIGGGTLFHDQGLKKNKNVEYYCGIIEKAAELKKDVIALGIGVDSIQLEENKKRIGKSMQKCKNIFVRDKDSATRLIEYGVSRQKITVIPDLVFALHIPLIGDAGPKNIKPVIGINLCPPIYGSPRDLTATIEEHLIPFMKHCREEYKFIFIPGHPGDLQYLPYLEEKTGLKLPYYNPEKNDYIPDFLRAVNRCDFLIASRYHILLMGVLLSKPTYALSYAEKTEALLKDFAERMHRFKGKLLKDDTKIPDQKKYKQQLKAAFQIYSESGNSAANDAAKHKSTNQKHLFKFWLGSKKFPTELY